MDVLAGLDRLAAALVKAVGFVGALCVVLIVIHVVADVASRLLFDHPLPGTIAFVSNFYMVAIVFLALALVERQDRHIAVDLIWTHLPPRARHWTGVFACLASAVVYGAIAISGWNLAVARYRVGAIIEENLTRVPVWPTYFLIPVGCAVMVLVALLRAVQMGLGREPHAGPADAGTQGA